MAEIYTFKDVTIYSHQYHPIEGIMRPILGYSRIEARQVSIEVDKSHVSVRFIPKGMRRGREYIENRKTEVTTVVIRGHGHPKVPRKSGPGPEPLYDKKWDREFEAFLSTYRLQQGVEVLLDLRELKPEPPVAPPPSPRPDSTSTPLFLGDEAVSVWEGHTSVRLHLKRERDQSIVRAKREQVLKSTGKLECEVCGFDFVAIYGIQFCEVHHLRPLAESEGLIETKLEDLAIVCSNCHRVIHRRAPFFSISELRILVQSRGANSITSESRAAIP